MLIFETSVIGIIRESYKIFHNQTLDILSCPWLEGPDMIKAAIAVSPNMFLGMLLLVPYPEG